MEHLPGLLFLVWYWLLDNVLWKRVTKFPLAAVVLLIVYDALIVYEI